MCEAVEISKPHFEQVRSNYGLPDGERKWSVKALATAISGAQYAGAAKHESMGFWEKKILFSIDIPISAFCLRNGGSQHWIKLSKIKLITFIVAEEPDSAKEERKENKQPEINILEVRLLTTQAIAAISHLTDRQPSLKALVSASTRTSKRPA